MGSRMWLDTSGSSRPICLVPLVGFLVLLVRWLKEPRVGAGFPKEQQLHEHIELSDAWIVTLVTLLGLALLIFGAIVLRAV